MWDVAFNYSGTWDQAYRHADECLKPLGYRLTTRSEDTAHEFSESAYLSPDNRIKARLMCHESFLLTGQSRPLYRLEIVVYNQPLGPEMPIVQRARPIP